VHAPVDEKINDPDAQAVYATQRPKLFPSAVVQAPAEPAVPTVKT